MNQRARTRHIAYTTGQALAHATLGTLALLRYRLTAAQQITINYTKEDGETSTRVIHPREVRRSKAGDWYVKAHDQLRDASRSFRLDRLTIAA